MEKYNLVIEDENNCRLDKVIALKMKDLSRTQIQEMISNGSVLVNGKVAKAGYKIKFALLPDVSIGTWDDFKGKFGY